MNMTMTYDGTMVMPKNFAVVTEDEMTYVEGGGTLKYSVSFRFTDALCQAAYAGGISTVIGTITACVSAALGATGIGASNWCSSRFSKQYLIKLLSKRCKRIH